MAGTSSAYKFIEGSTLVELLWLRPYVLYGAAWEKMGTLVNSDVYRRVHLAVDAVELVPRWQKYLACPVDHFFTTWSVLDRPGLIRTYVGTHIVHKRETGRGPGW